MRPKWLAILVMFLLALSADPSGAMPFIQTNTFDLGSQENLASEMALMANNIVLAGDARDDVFLMASPASMWSDNPQDGLITLSGTFDNDVWAMGKRIVLTGEIGDHARFAGQSIVLNGSIANSSVFIGNTVRLSRSADIAADALLMGEDLIAEGWVKGNLTLVGQNVTLAGTVGQDVDVTAQDLVALPGTEIMGDLTYRCPREFVPDSRVIVRGKIIRKPIPEKDTGFSMAALVYQGWLLLGALAVAMVFMAVFPFATTRAVQNLRYSLWRCMTIGGLVLCISPLALAVALISFIGIPLGLLCAAGLTVLIYLSKITVAISLGLWLLRRSNPHSFTQHLLPLIIGLLFIYTGVNSGLFGMVIWFLVTSAGLGSLILAFYRAPKGAPPSVTPSVITPPPPTTK